MPSAVNKPDLVYTVKQGDSLSKIAQAFYGNAREYIRIAEANGLDPNHVLPIGTRLRIPSDAQSEIEALEEVQVTTRRLPASGASNAPIDPSTGIETVTVQATRLPAWVMDWRVWAAAAVAAVVIWNLWDE